MAREPSYQTVSELGSTLRGGKLLSTGTLSKTSKGWMSLPTLPLPDNQVCAGCNFTLAFLARLPEKTLRCAFVPFSS